MHDGVNILLTGASGFVGRAVLRQLMQQGGYCITAALRTDRGTAIEGLSGERQYIIGDIGPETDWRKALSGQQVLIHAAARAHVLQEDTADPLAEYRRVNVAGTLALARQAAEAGVKRFVFISTIGVNGNISERPFTEEDIPAPAEFYAQSKWEAEQGLWQVQRDTGMELVIIRPPLAYGPGVPGNFRRLIEGVKSGIPLPLGAVHNQRTLIALDNLVDLIIMCVSHPAAANELFLAGDAQDVSTTELLRGVAQALGKPCRLIPVPASLLMLAATLLGKRAVAQRLLGSLQVDISKARKVLGWEPPLSVAEGLSKIESPASRLLQ